jgi:hypothetical protein
MVSTSGPRPPDGAASATYETGAPATAACASARTLRLRWAGPRHAQVRRVVVSVDGKRIATLGAGKHRITVRLSQPQHPVTISVSATTKAGHRLRAGLRYDGCRSRDSRMLRLRSVA